MSGDNLLPQALADLGIAWQLHEHPAVFTVEESEAIHAAMPGVHTKNLFLRDQGGGHWLVTVSSDCRVDLKALAPAIGARKLSFGKEEAMVELIGLTPGSVTPLAALNDTTNAVRIVLDTAVATAGQANVHPLRNTATIGLSGVDLCRALSAWEHDPLVIDVPRRPVEPE